MAAQLETYTPRDSGYMSKSITLSHIIQPQMESGTKIDLFIQSYFKHMYASFLNIQRGKGEQK